LKAEISREFAFEAAHHLPPVGPDHKCYRLHGHLFRVELMVSGDVDPEMGWVMDFGDLARVGREVIGELDHRVLNDFPGIGVPTSENIARYLFVKIASRVPELSAVTVHESPYSRCTFRPTAPQDLPGDVTISVACGEAGVVSAAHFLLFPPDGREPLHGHDYRMTLSATLDRASGPGLEERVAAAATRATATLEHRLILAGRPAVGTLERIGDEWVQTLPRETLRFPAADCVVLDNGNSTTEAIAAWIADRIASDPDLVGSGVRAIEVGLTESVGMSARVARHLFP